MYVFMFYTVVVAVFSIVSVPGQQVYAKERDVTDSEATEVQQARGHISGVVLQARDSQPVLLASIHIPELEMGTISHTDGDFFLANVPAGRHRLQVRYIGHETRETLVTVTRGDTVFVEFRLEPTVFRSATLEVIGRRRENGDLVTETAYTVSGRQLRRNLSRTISETLADEPGISERAMGPAPARPVLRGLGSDRLLILEDGGRTGDLSATSADHALAIEPMTAEEIQVIRGPAAIVHGSNTMGGVINVVREKIPLTELEHMHGSFSSQAESVNNGVSGGFNVRGPLAGQFHYRADGSLRKAGNISTPSGTLGNTGIETYNMSLGASRIGDRGLVGVSGNYYETRYGVPGGFTGAHPMGVDISMLRYYVDARARLASDSEKVSRYDLSMQVSQYKHSESPPDRPDVLAAEFGVLTYNTRLAMVHNGLLGGRTGAAGLWTEFRNFARGGGVFTPNTHEYSLAGFYYEQFESDRWDLQAALRYDIKSVVPQEAHTIRNARLLGFENTEAVNRLFQSWSASLSAEYTVFSWMQTGLVAMRSAKLPGIEELYADGPHLGAYTFEVGNPDLDVEHGVGLELYTLLTLPRVRMKVSAFRNRFGQYTFSEKIADSAPQNANLPLYQYMGERVLMSGLEMRYEWRVVGNVVTQGTLSFVQGTIFEPGQNIPFWHVGNKYRYLPEMPPLLGRADLEYRHPRFTLGTSLRFASTQNRLGDFEQSTPGYEVWNVYGEWRINWLGALHTVSVSADNLLNTRYYNHMNRIREIMPEPGFNLKILYRVYF